jgi:hypothetical protein
MGVSLDDGEFGGPRLKNVKDASQVALSVFPRGVCAGRILRVRFTAAYREGHKDNGGQGLWEQWN